MSNVRTRQVLQSDQGAQCSLAPTALPVVASLPSTIVIDDHDFGKNSECDFSSEANIVPYGTQMKRSPATRTRTRGKSKGKATKAVKGRRYVAEARNGLPTLRANPTMGYIFRYVSTGDVAALNGLNVKISDLARSMVVGVTADSYRYLFRSLRLHKVTIRSAPGTIGGTSSVGIQYRGDNTNEITIMDQSTRVDHNAVVSRSPPRFSLASFWHDVTNTTDDEKTLFSVYYKNDGSGTTYVDVHLSVVFDENRYLSYSIQDSDLSGLSAGGLYYGNLAVAGSAAQQLVPVGRIPLGV